MSLISRQHEYEEFVWLVTVEVEPIRAASENVGIRDRHSSLKHSPARWFLYSLTPKITCTRRKAHGEYQGFLGGVDGGLGIRRCHHSASSEIFDPMHPSLQTIFHL